ncbi:MAG: hypothetical protein M5U12_34080 [Verrucomicrobia bacterium]|nr:hypothetical protein [Verrucomicrobiota bacterium]
MDKRTKDLVVGSLAVAAIGMAVYWGLTGHSPRINLDPYEVLGAVTAEETAKLLRAPGPVLVMVRGAGAHENPSVEAQLKAFERSLNRQDGMRSITVRVEATPMLMMATGGGIPPDQLFEALAAHADVAAVVLFGGLPALSDPEVEALRKRAVKVVVVSSLRPDYGRLMEQGVLHLAVVPRPDSPPPGGERSRTLRERFDREYLLVTP